MTADRRKRRDAVPVIKQELPETGFGSGALLSEIESRSDTASEAGGR